MMNSITIFEKFPCGIMICKNDQYSTILEANSAVFKILGYTREEMLMVHGNRFSNLLVDNLEKMLEKVKTATIGEDNILDYEYRIRNKQGNIVWIHDIAKYDKTEDAFYVTIMDITYKAKELEEKISHERRDALTNLLNRYGLENQVGVQMDRSKGEASAMFLIQLDNFDTIIKNCERIEGDVVLVQAGERLKGIVDCEMTLGRMGENEFLIYLPDCKREQEIIIMARNILYALTFGYKEVELACSIGIAWDREGVYDFKTMYIMADEALYHARYIDKGYFHIHQ